MSYLVTARAWRPLLFRDVVSQSHVTETLRNAVRSGRVGHAYLFSGPRGVGKTTVARIFAKALNCERGPAEEPCNECSVCTGINTGSSLDIQELDGASNNSVDDVRELIASVGYHSGRCRFKMYIVDEVHMLSTPAFNALLKTLEEPPPGVVFVFATTEPQKVPATILSRCQRFDFHRLSVHDIAGKLRKIAEKDGISIDDAALMLIARKAGGAMRDGESILEQMKSSGAGETVNAADVTRLLGIADREIFFSVMEKCHGRDVRGVLDLFVAYYDGGGDLKEFAEGLLEHLRDLLYGTFEGGLDSVPVSDEMRDRLHEQAGWFGRDDILRMIAMVTDSESSLAYAVIPVLRIETALVRMASMDSTIELGRLLDMLGGAGTPVAAGTSAAPPTAGTPEAKPGRSAPPAEGKAPDDPVGTEKPPLVIPADFSSIERSWKELVERVQEQKPGIGPSLVSGVPESFDRGKLTVRFAGEHDFHRQNCERNRADIETVMGAVLGTPVTLSCLAGQTGGKGKRNSEVDDLIAREPVIGDILSRFDGEINDSWR
jgi:DNA polymerase III subunit gamma/tau